MSKRRNHDPAFKARVALEALKGECTVSELSSAYGVLPQVDKRRLRAEAALMCPQVVGGSRQRRKYVDAVMYLMTYRGVLCPQARDLYSAGSVGEQGPTDNFLINSLIDIQYELRRAAQNLEDALFLEYWGMCPEPEDRLLEWLRRADGFAQGWVPSDYLFLGLVEIQDSQLH